MSSQRKIDLQRDGASEPGICQRKSSIGPRRFRRGALLNFLDAAPLLRDSLGMYLLPAGSSSSEALRRGSVLERRNGRSSIHAA